MVRIRAPSFDTWWHQPSTWAEDPMSEIRDWIEDEAEREGAKEVR
jgi:hypothetical protein